MSDVIKFQVGDQVQLKIGGPLMVITTITNTPPGFLTAWFDRAQTLQKWTGTSLSPAILKLIDNVDMSRTDIKEGDTVTLGTNGPHLVVNSVYTNNSNKRTALCFWFDIDSQLQKAEFPTEALRIAD